MNKFIAFSCRVIAASCVLILGTAQAADFQSLNINDWGSGHIVQWQTIITQEDAASGTLDKWLIEPGYSGPGQVVNAWMNGYNGSVSTGEISGVYSITNQSASYRPEISIGATLSFSVQIQGAGYAESDYSAMLFDLTEQVPETSGNASFVSVNDWYNPSWGGGFNVIYRCDITDGPVNEWRIDSNYTGSGTVVNAWTQGYNGSVQHGAISPDGGYGITNENAPYIPTLTSGDSITYAFQVNGAGFSEGDFAPSCIDLNSTTEPPIENIAPIANAGSDQSVNLGSTVTIDGSNSSDADGDSLSYTWSIVSAPVNSQASLIDSANVLATFSPDIPGQYVISLVVSDGAASSLADEVVITLENLVPIAHAGVDQTVVRNTTIILDGGASSDPEGATLVTNTFPVANAGGDKSVEQNTAIILDGSGSSDADNDTLRYQWIVISSPSGSQVSLSDANTASANFSADTIGIYEASLAVSDGYAQSSDTISIVVTGAVGDSFVVVPDVSNQTESEALALLTQSELVLGQVSTRPSATVATGTVISQEPSVGRFVAAASAVDIYVSAGVTSAQIDVPNVIGLSREAAEKTLLDIGLLLGAVTSASSDVYLKNAVSIQAPVAGEQVALGATVQLTISTGPVSSTPSFVPVLAGVSQEQAEQLIRDADLAVGQITLSTHSTVSPGVVISQSLRAGSPATPGAPVDLLVSAGNDGLKVHITSPVSLQTVGASSIQVEGDISPEDATLTINGAVVDHSGGRFSALVDLQEGHNAVVASLNYNGVVLTDSISVSLDMTPPFVTIESHQNDEVVYSESIILTGLINDIVRGTIEQSQATVTVNGVSAVIANRSYSANVPLSDGSNVLNVVGVVVCPLPSIKLLHRIKNYL